MYAVIELRAQGAASGTTTILLRYFGRAESNARSCHHQILDIYGVLHKSPSPTLHYTVAESRPSQSRCTRCTY
jgi:hypothetical protein